MIRLFLSFVFVFSIVYAPAHGAEFLIKAVDATNSDPVKKERVCYERWDVVVVMPDGHVWGKEENPKTTTHVPVKMNVIKVSGLSVEEAKKYTQEQWDETDIDNPILMKRRLYTVDLDTIIFSNGIYSTTFESIRGKISNKVTGKTEANILR